MKKLIYILIFSLLLFFAQQKCYSQASAMAGFYSGYGQTLYNMKGYDPQGFMPLGIRAAIGNYGIQLGVDFNTNIKDPAFNIYDTTNTLQYSETVKDNYMGLMLRFHMGDEARDLAVILRSGIGYYISKRTVDYSDAYLFTNPGLSDGTVKYDNSPGYNAAFGFSIPTWHQNIHVNLEGQFNYNPRIYNSHKNFHSSWCVQLGVSYNFFHIYDLGHYK